MSLLLSDSFAQWVKTLSIQPDGGFYDFAVLDTNFFAGSSYGAGVFRSTDNGTSWAPVNTGLTNTYVNALSVSGRNIFAGTNGGIFLSTNNGTSWNATGLTTGVTSLAVSGMNLFAGGRSVFLSTNNGTSWTVADSGFVLHTSCYSLLVSGTNIFAVYGGTYFIPLRSALLLSTNNGTSWTVVDTSFTDSLVFSLAVFGTNLFAGGAGVHLSTNNGTTWTLDTAGIGFTPVNSFAVSGTNLFAGTYGGGVFLSTNNGTSWTAVNSGLPGGNVSYTRALTLVGTYLFVVTEDGVIWRRPLSEMVTGVDMSSTEIPEMFKLEQNYPNPFNPTTTVTYQLPRASQVSLAVFDVLGREVSVLVNERKNAGSYEVKFDGSGLASGVYFYRLQVRPLDSAIGRDSKSGAGDFVQTRRFHLLK